MALDSVTFQDANGQSVPVGVLTIGGAKCPAHVLVDATGNALGPSNPLIVAPGILAIDFSPLSGSIGAAGAVALDLPANPLRKAGYIRAVPTNQGALTITILKPGGVISFSEKFLGGSTFSFTIAPGYVLQHRVQVSGDTVGDLFEAVEFA